MPSSKNKTVEGRKHAILTWLSLFASTGTLVCCALPALLVSLGMGAALAGFVSNFPQLIWLSENKPAVFGVSGALILTSAAIQFGLRNQPCPIDPELRKACLSGRRFSWYILGASAAVFVTGSYFAFFAA